MQVAFHSNAKALLSLAVKSHQKRALAVHKQIAAEPNSAVNSAQLGFVAPPSAKISTPIPSDASTQERNAIHDTLAHQNDSTQSGVSVLVGGSIYSLSASINANNSAKDESNGDIQPPSHKSLTHQAMGGPKQQQDASQLDQHEQKG